MAVGIGSITLLEVITEVGGSTGDSLLDCFTNATGTFDPTYEGSKDRLSNFQGYEHTASYNSFICGYTTPEDAGKDVCNVSPRSTTRYSIQTRISTTFAADGDLWSDAGTTLADAGFYRDSFISANWYYWSGTAWTNSGSC